MCAAYYCTVNFHCGLFLTPFLVGIGTGSSRPITISFHPVQLPRLPRRNDKCNDLRGRLNEIRYYDSRCFGVLQQIFERHVSPPPGDPHPSAHIKTELYFTISSNAEWRNQNIFRGELFSHVLYTVRVLFTTF